MQRSPKDVFYFMSDLTDAFADLSIAMRKWQAELENSLPDADSDSATITKQTAHSASAKIEHTKK